MADVADVADDLTPILIPAPDLDACATIAVSSKVPPGFVVNEPLLLEIETDVAWLALEP